MNSAAKNETRFDFHDPNIPRMSGSEFRQRTEKNPGWAKELTEPVRVIDRINMDAGIIQSLSPYLVFAQKADFSFCHRLKVATGIFLGQVSFHGSAVSEIDPEGFFQGGTDVSIADGSYASFRKCPITHAHGSYPGNVDFSHCAQLTHIGRLVAPSASFRGCRKIERAPLFLLEHPKYVFDEDIRIELAKQAEARMALKQPDLEL